MSPSRRVFLKNSAVTLMGTALLPYHLKTISSKPRKLTGIQLYSVRDEMKKDPLGTLKLLAEAGYKYVEHANYVDHKFYGYTAADFKKQLDSLGLKMPSGHTVMNKSHWDENNKDFTDNWKRTVDDAAIVGQKFVISPWLDESLRKDYEGLSRFLELFNKSGLLCQKAGMKFGYHNHNFEFSSQLNGMKIYDIILKQTDPQLVIQQIDIGNMYGAGGIALDIMKQYPGRFASMHVKDEIKSTRGEMSDGYESTTLGKGILPVKEILSYAEKHGGTTDFIIEQESYQGRPPIDCAAEDFKAMKNWGF